MTNSRKRLLIMLGAVALMGGLLALLLLGGGDDHDHEHDHLSASDAPIADENDLLIYRDSDEMERMVLTNSSGVYTMQRDAEGELLIKELAGMPQNTDFIEMIWYTPISLGYTDTIKLPADSVNLADYGLAPPAATIRAFFTDGTEAFISIGSAVLNSEDTYYFTLEGDNTIYATQFDAALFLDSKYWLSDNMFSSNYDEDAVISKISIQLAETKQPLVIVPHTPADKSDPFYSYDYIMTSPELCAADNYFMSELIYELSWLTAYDTVTVNPDEETLASYGLDKPYAVLNVVRNGENHTLRLAYFDYRTLYATVDDIPVIYQIDTDSNPALGTLSYQSIRSVDVHVRYFDAIESITVKHGKTAYVFRTERSRLNGSSELYEYHSFCGKNELNLSSYKAFLEVFNLSSAAGYSSKKPDGDPALTVIIDYFDSFGRESETITYTEVDTRRYLCRINGEGSAVVTSMWLDKFIASAEALAAGENVTP